MMPCCNDTPIEYGEPPNWPGYRVGNDGSLWSLKREGDWHRLATLVNVNGYETVGLWRDGQRTLKLVHTMVLEAFVGPRPKGMWGLHRNDNRLDNALLNLYWGTHADNIQDAQRNKRFRVGLAHPQGRISNHDIQRIRERYAEGESQRALARAFDVSQGYICKIVNGYRRLDTSAVEDNVAPKVSCALSVDDVRNIRSLCAQGHSQIAVARLLGVSIAVVSGIIRGRRHKHVQG